MAVLMRAVAFICVFAGCGLGFIEDEPGGSSNLPTAGIGPYGKLPIDRDTPAQEPVVLEDTSASLFEPSILPRGDGGYRIFVERREDDGPSEIWAAEIPSLTDLPDVPLRRVFAATLPWQQGEVRAPSVASVGGEIILAYEAGSPPAIGIAVSSDGGETFEPRAEPTILGARSPSISHADDTFHLWYERVGEHGIHGAFATELSVFSDYGDALLIPTTIEGEFDSTRTQTPEIIARITTAGRLRFDLFYQGDNGDGELAIGYAGGFAAEELARTGPRGVPILEPGPPSDESPTVIIEPTRGVMLFVDRRGGIRPRIAGATSP